MRYYSVKNFVVFFEHLIAVALAICRKDKSNISLLWIIAAGIIKNMLPTPHKWGKRSIKHCPIGDCNLAQDVTAMRQEANSLDPLIFKTVGKISYSIIYRIESYYYIFFNFSCFLTALNKYLKLDLQFLFFDVFYKRPCFCSNTTFLQWSIKFSSDLHFFLKTHNIRPCISSRSGPFLWSNLCKC